MIEMLEQTQTALVLKDQSSLSTEPSSHFRPYNQRSVSRIKNCDEPGLRISSMFQAALKSSFLTLFALLDLGEIQEGDVRGVTYGRVVPSEIEATGFPVNPEGGDVIPALVAGIEEFAGRVKAEAARIVSACPFVADETQCSVWAHREDTYRIMQAVACVDKAAVGRDQNF